MNKKLVVMLGLALCVMGAFARPHGGGPGGHGGPGGFHGGPAPHHHGGHHGGGVWGHGGRNFWPGFVGGVIAGGLTRAIVDPAPVVVTTPTVVTPVVAAPVVAPTVVAAPVVTAPVTTTQNVWVEGCYVNQVQANGAVIRVWQPGHYEARTVVMP